jgi:UDP-N-acetylglucosamine/UDP-N-acetylgalactosamine diphosphorylase
MYDIEMPSGRTLFQMIAERILKLKNLTESQSLPFYIMTSPLNHQTTVDYFQQNNYFGLGKDNVIFFQQGMLPCLTDDGKIIMESANKASMAPDGNGGIYPSLQASGSLQDMERRGVQYVHVFSIDNALVKPADPAFCGYCIHQQADCGNKVVWKAHPHEAVGVVAQRGGRPCIVEYSEISKEMAERTKDGVLVFGAANICNHFYSLSFLRDTILPNMKDMYHIARKKIPYYDSVTKTTVVPDSPNGIKLETFIFDVFGLSRGLAVFEVERSEEFSPVKNQTGTDSSATAREMLSALFQKWLEKAGARLVGDGESLCEIAPSTSYGGEGLEAFEGKVVQCPFTV